MKPFKRGDMVYVMEYGITGTIISIIEKSVDGSKRYYYFIKGLNDHIGLWNIKNVILLNKPGEQCK